MIITKYPSDYEGLNYVEFLRLVLRSKKIVFINKSESPRSILGYTIDELLAGIDKILNLLCNADVNVTRKSKMCAYERSLFSTLPFIIYSIAENKS